MTPIDEYLQHVSPAERAALERVRKITKEIDPSATEGISYGMPALKHDGKYLIGFSQFKDHLSIFPGAEPIEILKDKLKDFKTSKGTIQFTLDKPIPDPLLREVLQLCFDRVNK